MVRLGTKWPSITSTCRRSATSLTRSTSAPSSREVGGQDRRRQLHRGHARRRSRTSARRRSRTNMPSVPAACGSRSAPRPYAVHGAPGGGAATNSGRFVAAHSSTPSVSSLVRVHTEYDEDPTRSHERCGRRRAGRAAAWPARRSCRVRRRQRASGRRRSTPIPLHGASSSTRSNIPARSGGPRGVADDREELRRARCGGGRRRSCGLARRRRRARRPTRRRPPARRSRWPCRRVRRRDRRSAPLVPAPAR